MNAHIRAVLVLLVLAAINQSSAALAQEFNRYNWEWEELESRDVIHSALTDNGRYAAVVTHSLEGLPLRPNFGPGAYVVLFDTASNQPLWAFLLPFVDVFVTNIALSENAELVAAIALDWLFVLNREGEEEWRIFLPDMGPNSLTVTADGQYLALVTYLEDPDFPYVGPTVMLFDRNDSDPLWIRTLAEQFGVAAKFSDDGRFLAVATVNSPSINPALYFFDTAGTPPQRPVWSYRTTQQASNWTNMALSDDGAYVAIQANNELYFFDTADPGAEPKEPLWIRRAGGYSSTTHSVDLSGDGALLVHGGPYQESVAVEFPGVLEVWNTSAGEVAWTFEHRIKGPSVAISENGHYVVLSGNISDADEPALWLFPSSVAEPIWITDVHGPVAIDGEGEHVLTAGGVMIGYNIREYQPMFMFARELNIPPLCDITDPSPGASVSGTFLLQGTADDSDGQLRLVQIGHSGRYVPAQDVSPSGDWTLWNSEIDLSGIPNGEFTLYAQAIDSYNKHSAPAQVTVMVDNATPAPSWTPLYSPTPSPTATVTPTPSPTPRNGPLVFTLELNQSIFIGGDSLLLTGVTVNDGPRTWINRYIVLEVYGEYYFHPWWDKSPEYTILIIPEGERYREPLLGLGLPDDLPAGGPFYFLGAVQNQLTLELIGTISAVPFIFR